MKNLNAPHITDAEKQAIDAAIAQIKAILLPKIVQFSPDERQRYGAVDEKNKLFINKVAELNKSQPNLAAAEVDWVKFENDYADRAFLSELLLRLQSLTYDIQSTKIAHDNDNNNAARIDYSYIEYCAKSDVIGAVQKYNELKKLLKHDRLTKEEKATKKEAKEAAAAKAAKESSTSEEK